MLRSQELAALQRFAQIGKQFGSSDLEHLDAPMGAFNYIRMVNCIFEHAKKHWKNTNQPFLDWGAGYGQVTWLLRNRGISAQGYNIERRPHMARIPELKNLPMIYHHDPVVLPFADCSFEGVSSCGVLEHVENPKESLREIHRVLKPGGYFYLFMLPQKTSWVEVLSEWRGKSVHPVRYTTKEMKQLLKESGFVINRLWKFNLIPKNLTGLPQNIKYIYGRLYKWLYPLDHALSAVPILNLLSGVIEGVAQKRK